MTNYQYSKSTSTTGLRGHIRKHHLELYMLLAPQKGWKPLLSQAPSQVTTEAKALQVPRQGEFDVQRFHRCLLNFIVADDQVRHLLSFLYLPCSCFLVSNCKSLNIVECPEFRQLLLLLQPDLKKSIPHRTKIHTLLLQAWREYFQELRRDLAACFPHPLS